MKMDTGLSYRELRSIETQLGVYLDRPKEVYGNGQEFQVYDEDERLVGKVTSSRSKFFTREELIREINKLFGK